MLQRRGLLLGLLAAPAIIRTPGLLMAVRPVDDVLFLRLMNPDDTERVIEVKATPRLFWTGMKSEWLLGEQWSSEQIMQIRSRMDGSPPPFVPNRIASLA